MAYKAPPPLTVTTTQFDVLVGGTLNTIASVGPGSSGQILQSAGASSNPVYSTATYPATATGTGKILRADGTNWVASTATYPDTAGTSGNVLKSDGTNWSSAAPTASGLGYVLNIINRSTGSNPADGVTYFPSANSFTSVTTSGNASARIYVPKAGTISKVYGAITVQGTLGSATNCTLDLRLNNTSDTTISSTLQLNTASNAFNATVSIAVSAGDFLEFKFISPTWPTNPTTVAFSASMYIS